MDEAFRSLPDLLPQLLPLADPIRTADGSIRTSITGCTVETPIELDLSVSGGVMEIGGAPPLYHLSTSQTPVFHTLRIVVEAAENPSASGYGSGDVSVHVSGQVSRGETP